MYPNHDDFQFLEFYCSFYTVKGSSVGWNRQRIHFSKSNSLSISVEAFLRTNTVPCINSSILVLLALNTRISYEYFFRNLGMKYPSKFVAWNLADERMHINTQLSLSFLIQHFKVNVLLKSYQKSASNQWTGFYMITASVMKGLVKSEHWLQTQKHLFI